MISAVRSSVEQSGMPAGQRWLTVAIATLIVVIDGFDLLALSLASPALPRSWGLDHTTLGLLLSLGPAGMAIGSFFLAPFADRFGRRPVILAGLVLVCASMLAAGLAGGAWPIGLARLATGLGVGTLTPVLNATVTEIVSLRRRSLVLAFVAAGLPIGSTIGGILSIPLLDHFGWRAIFYCGSALSALALVLTFLLVPETPAFLNMRRSAGSIGHTLDSSDKRPSITLVARYRNLNGDVGFLSRTLLICLISFAVQLSIYFIVQWIPRILSDAGLSANDAISVSIAMNFGGIFGALMFGFIARPSNVHALTAAYVLLSFLLICSLPWIEDLQILRALALAVGIAIYGVGVGLYTLIVNAYPTQTRVSGIGISIGTGRIGAILGPLLAGILISLGWSRPLYFTVLALPLLVAAFAIFCLHQRMKREANRQHPVLV